MQQPARTRWTPRFGRGYSVIVPVAVCALTLAWAGVSAHPSFSKKLPANLRIQQALNRLTFGPRPGDAEQVRKIGLKKWIDLQLHPDRIPESPVLEEAPAAR